MKKVVWVLFALLLAATLAAAVHAHKLSGLSVWFPDDWEVEADENEISADAAGEEAFALLEALPEAEDIESALAALEEALADEFEEIKLPGEPQEQTQNGLRVFSVSGAGRRDDQSWEFSAMLIESGPGTALFIAGCESRAAEKCRPVLQKIVLSIKKI